MVRLEVIIFHILKIRFGTWEHNALTIGKNIVKTLKNSEQKFNT
jgi:hypothetical protein